MVTAFAEWVRAVTGRAVAGEEIEALMAAGDPDVDPLDVFVEEAVIKRLHLAGLALPATLQTQSR